MKIKLDENIPASLSARLATLGHDVDSVPEEGLTGYPDAAVWSEAQEKIDLSPFTAGK
jgi:predicted nuclease of predicted toxin-antitoxin system